MPFLYPPACCIGCGFLGGIGGLAGAFAWCRPNCFGFLWDLYILALLLVESVKAADCRRVLPGLLQCGKLTFFGWGQAGTRHVLIGRAFLGDNGFAGAVALGQQAIALGVGKIEHVLIGE